LVIELEAITAINCDTLAGGLEPLPGAVVQRSPHCGGLLGVLLAKPLNEAGADPPLSELSFDHRAPQNVILLPIAAFWSPTTKDPWARSVIERTFTLDEPFLVEWVESPL
jgi:hypothetical protein